jgi:large subunit ribosomal protein L30e
MENKPSEIVEEQQSEKEYPVIKKAMKDKSLVIGTERSLAMLKTGKLKEVLVTKNCPKEMKEDIAHYAKLSSTKVTDLDINNDELGAVCKKPFAISVASIKK